MAAALAVVAGWVPRTVSEELIPVLDSVQGGIGLGIWRHYRIVGANGAATSLQIDGEVGRARIVRFSVSCTVAGVSDLQVSIFENQAGAFIFKPIAVVTPADLVLPWGDFAEAHTWLYVPPNHTIVILMSGIPLGVNTIECETCTVPEGTKPW